ncbi:PGN_0703 family putative restriction endonuclease [Thioclava sp. FR2]|uniref:PGN_0703 family putative restriction endonuclease n=1 Tax=Thioclava sp. FR2 TaxID=3445780 RepID=UPI003EBDC60B
MTDPEFLPGVPGDLVLAALRRSPGNELASGKFSSPESSAALAANAFGWFLERPTQLPALPSVPMGAPLEVQIEAEMHFPWRGGRHPWLDAAITTATTLVGVESKRYEPFRPKKATSFTEAYGSRDWGQGMAPWNDMRLALEKGAQTYSNLDAVQLVKHAYGLKTQAAKRGLGAVLVYLHAAPAQWANGKPVSPTAIAQHEAEIASFAQSVRGADVTFVALRWADLLGQWAANPALAEHSAAVSQTFGPI